MKYAAIWESEGRYLVAQIFDTPNDEPIENYYAQGDLAAGQWYWAPYSVSDPSENWVAELIGGEWKFRPDIPDPLSQEQIILKNQRDQEYLKMQASLAMTPVLLSLQLNEATDVESTKAREWQAYYRQLEQVDLTVSFPEWPATPE